MAGEVPLRQLRDRFLARQSRLTGRTFVEKGVGELLPNSRAAADHAVHLGPHEDMGEPLAVGCDARAGERLT
jgi:hypothetical protein